MTRIPAPRDEARICVGHHRHEPERPRRATHGHLCTGCHARLEQTLAEYPARYSDLGRALAAAKGHGQHVTGTPERQLPVNVAVVDHRSHMHGVLMSWAALTAEESDTGTPGHLDVESLAVWLLARLAWICEQPWVDEFAAEIGEASNRARNLLQPSGRRRIPVARCPEDGCVGNLTAVIGPVDDLLPSVISCDTQAEHEWSADKWMTLGRKMRGEVGA